MAGISNMYDIEIPADAPQSPIYDEHANFVLKFNQDKEDYEFVMSDFLRINAVYWSVTALELLGKRSEVDELKEEVFQMLEDCKRDDGGYAPAPRHDSSLLCTLSAVQIACIYGRRDLLDVDKICEYVKSMQKEDGSFTGDKWGEVDTRFSFGAVATLRLLDMMHIIDVDKATEFVVSCRNFDSGFGSKPGSESHAGLIYCCVGFLSLVGRLDLVDADRLGWWLAERQLKGSGGLNGRPEKLPDVCYGWWVLASLAMLGRLHWIDSKSMRNYILACQDKEDGGISDRPQHMPDPFHTLFGVGGLSLLGDKTLQEVNPVFCMPQKIIDELGIEKPQILKSP